MSPDGAAPKRLLEAGAPAGVVEFRPPNMEGFAGVEAAVVDVFAAVFPNMEGAGVVEAGVVLPNMLLLDWVAGGVLAAGGLLSLLPNKLPDGKEPPAVEVPVFEVLAAGGVLVFPKIEGAGLLAAPAPPNMPPEDDWEPPPNKLPEAGWVLLLPPNSPPPPPVGVEALEPEFAPAAALPNKDLPDSAGLAPALPNKPGPPVADVVLLAGLLLAPPWLPKEKPDEPDCPPNKLDEEVAGAGVVEPNREPEAGALEVVALLDWPAALAPPKEKDMIGAWLQLWNAAGGWRRCGCCLFAIWNRDRSAGWNERMGFFFRERVLKPGVHPCADTNVAM